MADCQHTKRKPSGSCATCSHMKWVAKNRERMREYDRAYYARNPEKFAAAHRKHRAKDPARYLASVSVYRERTRLRAIEKMGGGCEVCGITDELVLEFDHRIPIRRQGKTGYEVSMQTHHKILRMNNPKDTYALLCANCHRRKTRLNGDQKRTKSNRENLYV